MKIIAKNEKSFGEELVELVRDIKNLEEQVCFGSRTYMHPYIHVREGSNFTKIINYAQEKRHTFFINNNSGPILLSFFL